ncbi:MAG: methyltransferase domain-containing protein [Polyangiaceae bacterium]
MASDITVYNEGLYEGLWRHAHFRPPTLFPWWPVVESLATGTVERLEIGPGVWPKLPVKGTHVLELAEHARKTLEREGAIVHGSLLADAAFADGRFELVGFFEVLEHVDDDVAFLRDVARVTKPGGRVVLSVPLSMKRFTAYDAFIGHARRYEPAELKEKLDAAGLRMDRFEVRGGGFGPGTAKFVVGLCKIAPRFVLWLTESVVLPLGAKTKIDWRDASEWDVLSADAAECAVVCTRV